MISSIEQALKPGDGQRGFSDPAGCHENDEAFGFDPGVELGEFGSSADELVVALGKPAEFELRGGGFYSKRRVRPIL